MSTSYIPYLPDQQYLMPCALQEWLPEGHLAYFINDTVDSLELKASIPGMQVGAHATSPFIQP